MSDPTNPPPAGGVRPPEQRPTLAQLKRRAAGQDSPVCPRCGCRLVRWRGGKPQCGYCGHDMPGVVRGQPPAQANGETRRTRKRKRA